MASPVLSDSNRSLPSSSRPSSPSTAPSTPDYAPLTYILVAHDASESFLKGLPVQASNGDRVLFFNGTGLVKDLLAVAGEVLEEMDIANAEKWEKVSEDGVVYWKTKSDVAKVATAIDDAVHFEKLEASSAKVGPRSWVYAPLC
jgi:hypothetical protein